MSINATRYSRLNVRRRIHELTQRRMRLVSLFKSLKNFGDGDVIVNRSTYDELTDIINELQSLRRDMVAFHRDIYD